jgi:hypothetical protein
MQVGTRERAIAAFKAIQFYYQARSTLYNHLFTDVTSWRAGFCLGRKAIEDQYELSHQNLRREQVF